MGTFALTLFGLAACSGPLAGLFRGDPLDFGTIDVDKDSVISPRELNTWGEEEGLVAAFGGGEEGVAPVDLASALYAVWNLDGDTLTESEWTAGLTTFFPGEDAGTFAEWDIDQDMALDENELRAGFAHSGIASAWDDDGDGNVAARELYAGLFAAFDQDDDDAISAYEWRALASRLPG